MENPGKRLIVLEGDAVEALYGRPLFTHEERVQYFALSPKEKSVLDQDHWDRFYQYVTTPPEKPEDFSWPEDPMFCLACATTVHFSTEFHAKRLRPHCFQTTKRARAGRMVL